MRESLQRKIIARKIFDLSVPFSESAFTFCGHASRSASTFLPSFLAAVTQSCVTPQVSVVPDIFWHTILEPLRIVTYDA